MDDIKALNSRNREGLPLTAETIRGRRIVVSYSKNVRSVKKCHVLFVTKSEKSRIKHTISKFKGSPVLTVSDVDDFVKAGGMIGMIRLNNKIRFHINLVSVQDSG
ncbi:MAG: YfiR family protein [Desulfobacterales bacterium]|nr:YfiR family protein [Desulfobacterales bacterium]